MVCLFQLGLIAGAFQFGSRLAGSKADALSKSRPKNTLGCDRHLRNANLPTGTQKHPSGDWHSQPLHSADGPAARGELTRWIASSASAAMSWA